MPLLFNDCRPTIIRTLFLLSDHVSLDPYTMRMSSLFFLPRFKHITLALRSPFPAQHPSFYHATIGGLGFIAFAQKV